MIVLAAAVSAAAWTPVPAPLAPATVTTLAIVVHQDNPASALTVADLQRIFRKQMRMWPHGESVVPVDWDATSEVRQEFSRRVLGRTVREMSEFWVQQSLTQGLTPPSTLKSSRAMLRFVASVPGAIGYLPAGEADETVRTIVVKGLR